MLQERKNSFTHTEIFYALGELPKENANRVLSVLKYENIEKAINYEDTENIENDPFKQQIDWFEYVIDYYTKAEQDFIKLHDILIKNRDTEKVKDFDLMTLEEQADYIESLQMRATLKAMKTVSGELGRLNEAILSVISKNSVQDDVQE